MSPECGMVFLCGSPMSPESQKSSSLVHIDVLRGVAILMVMVTHGVQRVPDLPGWLANFSKYGQMGVQLFFVVSAYTLCLSAARRRGEPRPLTSFWIRRLFRIAPMYYLGIVVYAVVDVAVRSSPDLTGFVDPTAWRVMVNMTFLHGFVPEANNIVVPGGWSIGTEMAFYALFPLLFLGLQTLLRRGGLAWVVMVPLAALMINGGVQWVLAETTALVLANNTFLYFNLVNQLPVFLTGMALYLHHQRRGLPRVRVPMAGAGVVFFTGLSLLLNMSWGDRAFAVIPLVSAVSFVCLFELARTVRCPGEALLARVGQLSYSMYVLHFLPAWYLSEWMAEDLARNVSPLMHAAIVLLTTFLVTFGLATVCERWVEKPGIRFGRHLIEKRRRPA